MRLREKSLHIGSVWRLGGEFHSSTFRYAEIIGWDSASVHLRFLGDNFSIGMDRDLFLSNARQGGFLALRDLAEEARRK